MLRFSRHARNRMRLYGVKIEEVIAIVNNPMHAARDGSSRWRYEGALADGRRVKIIVAREDQPFVITIAPIKPVGPRGEWL